MSFASKVIAGGVFVKALIMGILVALLATTTFERSIVLVLVSATATGFFGILIVLIQVHSERNIHRRIDALETTTTDVVTQAKDEVTTKTDEAVTQVSQQISEAVSPSEPWNGEERRETQ